MNLRERINFRLCVIFLSPGSWTFSLLELSASFSFACSLVRKEYEQGKQNLRCSSIQRKWQRYLCSLNKQQFFGIVRKEHYVNISKEFTARMVRQNAWEVLLFNEKVGDVNIYIHSVILVTNSYGESWDSSCVKYSVPVQKQWVPDAKNIQVCNWKCLDLCVTRQLIWLISLTDSKTLYYWSTLKLKYSPSKG